MAASHKAPTAKTGREILPLPRSTKAPEADRFRLLPTKLNYSAANLQGVSFDGAGSLPPCAGRPGRAWRDTASSKRSLRNIAFLALSPKGVSQMLTLTMRAD